MSYFERALQPGANQKKNIHMLPMLKTEGPNALSKKFRIKTYF